MKTLDILLVEDNPDDVELAREALNEAQVPAQLTVAEDGVDAMKYLRSAETKPDLILLDLNLPRKTGFQILEEIKPDPELGTIPVVVLTTSDEERDVLRAYKLHANGYVVKPVDLDEFIRAVKAITEFWGSIVTLPPE